jgi:hypothetical protein
MHIDKSGGGQNRKVRGAEGGLRVMGREWGAKQDHYDSKDGCAKQETEAQ